MTSEVCIYDMTSGEVHPVLQSEHLLEAPNWTTDGLALIVNATGRLYRIDLDNPELDEIHTDFAVTLNNDHGLSPDGQHLAISDSTEDGLSNIYILPAGGGRPVRITQTCPSYWHGWSPDGATLAFVGKRNEGVFNVFTIPRNGGAETALTQGFEHTDGPDFTPDGQWIWFNAQKDGAMQLWRMRPDGTDQQQMTDDERWNWFPHPSPDGKHVLYLAYESGTTGHPRDRNVELRLIPAVGGTPKILLSLFGGQGTINVPCWSPGGGRFAFVRYTPPEATAH